MLITTDADVEDLQKCIRINSSIVKTSIKNKLGIKYLVLSPQSINDEKSSSPVMFQLKIQNRVLDSAMDTTFAVILAAITSTFISYCMLRMQ
jgi:hypothetical protein